MGFLDSLRGRKGVTVVGGSIAGSNVKVSCGGDLVVSGGGQVGSISTKRGETRLINNGADVSILDGKVHASVGGRSFGPYLIDVSNGNLSWRDAHGNFIDPEEFGILPDEVRTAVEGYYAKEAKHEAPLSGPTVAGPAMAKTEFKRLVDTLDDASFDSNRLEILQLVAGGKCFSSSQIAEILDTFSFDPDRLKALGELASKATDWSAGESIKETFSFENSIDKAQQIIERG